MDKIEVYHAETERVENPDCKRGRINLDFGQGFYITVYTQGFISQERALQNLRYQKPNNQICIINQKLLDKYLEFGECLEISLIN